MMPQPGDYNHGPAWPDGPDLTVSTLYDDVDWLDIRETLASTTSLSFYDYDVDAVGNWTEVVDNLTATMTYGNDDLFRGDRLGSLQPL